MKDRKIHTACYGTARYLADQIRAMGPFEIIFDGDMNRGIPALCWKLKPETTLNGYSLYDLADRLRARGWQVPAYALPARCEDVVIQRILVRHGVSRDLANLLLEDMRRALEHFDTHPTRHPLSAGEGCGFHH